MTVNNLIYISRGIILTVGYITVLRYLIETIEKLIDKKRSKKKTYRVVTEHIEITANDIDSFKLAIELVNDIHLKKAREMSED